MVVRLLDWRNSILKVVTAWQLSNQDTSRSVVVDWETRAVGTARVEWDSCLRTSWNVWRHVSHTWLSGGRRSALDRTWVWLKGWVRVRAGRWNGLTNSSEMLVVFRAFSRHSFFLYQENVISSFSVSLYRSSNAMITSDVLRTPSHNSLSHQWHLCVTSNTYQWHDSEGRL
jgi:hypothetical protein